jgi:hypothetical protein
MGDENPCGQADDRRLEGFAGTSMAGKPREGPFDYAPTGLLSKSLGGVGAFDDLVRPLSDRRQRVA